MGRGRVSVTRRGYSVGALAQTRNPRPLNIMWTHGIILSHIVAVFIALPLHYTTLHYITQRITRVSTTRCSPPGVLTTHPSDGSDLSTSWCDLPITRRIISPTGSAVPEKIIFPGLDSHSSLPCISFHSISTQSTSSGVWASFPRPSSPKTQTD